MTNSSIEFDRLNNELLLNPIHYLIKWLPGGRVEGGEYVCSSIQGGRGSSFKCNLKKGVWKDFATGEGGGDLVALYAAINNIKQIEAANEISQMINFVPTDQNKYLPSFPKEQPSHEALQPPKEASAPNFYRKNLGGDPTLIHKYTDKEGNQLFYIARYDIPGKDKKQIRPFTWSHDGTWINKQWPDKRPLYNLHEVYSKHTKNVLIVEGEKAAEAAMKVLTGYVVTTWPGGSNAVKKVDWSILRNRKVLVWPDNDEPGIKARNVIINQIKDIALEVKWIEYTEEMDFKDGFDAADAFQELKWSNKDFLEFARDNHNVYIKPERKIRDAQVLPKEEKPKEDKNSLRLTRKEEQTRISLLNDLGMICNKSMNPIANTFNATRYLENYTPVKNTLWYDEFHQKIFICWPNEEPREIEDTDYVKLLVIAQSEVMFTNLKKHDLRDAVLLTAKKDVRNEPKAYIESLTWDKTNRLDQFFQTYFGVKDSLYTQQVSKNFWIGMIARICKPGCKVDNMVVLESSQGYKKSSALKIIAGAWAGSSGEKFGTKDFYLIMRGKLLIEVAELDSFGKSDISTVKRVLSEQVDSYREPYGMTVKDFKRQCIFIGTVNKDEYLTDITGNRRFWPVTVTNIDHEKLEEDRDQLYAEALHRFKQGETWWEIDQQQAQDEQDARMEYDVWHDVVSNYCEGKREITVYDVLIHGLGADKDKLTRQQQIRVTNILKRCGFEKGKRKKTAAGYSQFWINPSFKNSYIQQAKEVFNLKE